MNASVRRLLPIVALFLVAAVTVAAPPKSPSVKDTIQALYNKENAAAANKDVDGMIADYDPKVVAVSQSGETKGYDDLVNAAKEVLQIAKTIKATTQVEGVTTSGNQAVATTHDSVIMTIAEPTTGHDVVIATTSTSRDTWSNASGHWKVVRSEEISHTATMDGQPIPGI